MQRYGQREVGLVHAFRGRSHYIADTRHPHVLRHTEPESPHRANSLGTPEHDILPFQDCQEDHPSLGKLRNNLARCFHLSVVALLAVPTAPAIWPIKPLYPCNFCRSADKLNNVCPLLLTKLC